MDDDERFTYEKAEAYWVDHEFDVFCTIDMAGKGTTEAELIDSAMEVLSLTAWDFMSVTVEGTKVCFGFSSHFEGPRDVDDRMIIEHALGHTGLIASDFDTVEVY